MNQKGALPLIVLLAVVGILGVLVIINFAPFKDKMYASLFPKENSHASEGVEFNITDFGAKGDGTNDTEAFQRAINAVATVSGTLKIPGDGTTNYLIKDSLSLKSNIKIIGSGAKITKGNGIRHLFTASKAVENITLDGLILDKDSNPTSGHLLLLPNGSNHITINNSHFINVINAPAIEFMDGNNKNTDIKITNSSIERTLEKQSFENVYSMRIYNGENILIENNLFSKCSSIEIVALSAQANAANNPSRNITIKDNTFTGVQSTNLFVEGSSKDQTFFADVSISNNTFSDGGKWIEKGAMAIYTGLNSSIKNLTITNNQIKDLGFHGSSEGYACCNVTQMIYLAGQNRDQNSWGNPVESIENATITGNVIDGISTSRIAYGILAQPNIKIVNWKVTNNTVKNMYYPLIIKPTSRENVIIENNNTPEEIKARDDKKKAAMLDIKKAMNTYKATNGNYCLGVTGCAVSINVNCNNCYSGEPKNAVDTLRALLMQKDRFTPDIGLRIINQNSFWLLTKLENPPTTTCPVITSAAKWYFEPTDNYCIGN